MEYFFTKIKFKDKEYLVLSLDEEISLDPKFQKDMNDKLSEMFGEDKSDILFFPTKVHFFGFENINTKEKNLENGS